MNSNQIYICFIDDLPNFFIPLITKEDKDKKSNNARRDIKKIVRRPGFNDTYFSQAKFYNLPSSDHYGGEYDSHEHNYICLCHRPLASRYPPKTKKRKAEEDKTILNLTTVSTPPLVLD